MRQRKVINSKTGCEASDDCQHSIALHFWHWFWSSDLRASARPARPSLPTTPTPSTKACAQREKCIFILIPSLYRYIIELPLSDFHDSDSENSEEFGSVVRKHRPLSRCSVVDRLSLSPSTPSLPLLSSHSTYVWKN